MDVSTLLRIVSAIATIVLVVIKVNESMQRQWRDSDSPTATMPEETMTSAQKSRGPEGVSGSEIVGMFVRFSIMGLSAAILFMIASNPGFAGPLSTREAALIAINLGIFLMASRTVG